VSGQLSGLWVWAIRCVWEADGLVSGQVAGLCVDSYQACE